LVLALVLMGCADAADETGDGTAASDVEGQIAALKTASAELAARELAAPGTITDPPKILRVEGAIAGFRDCEQCPEMVIVPAGEFTMGTPANERFRGDEAQHRVTIRAPFAVSKFEITWEEWETCVAEGGCEGFTPTDEGFGKERRPVINVSYRDAHAYLEWLKTKTGKNYRLLSESEWEYAARAGTTTAFAFEPMSSERANYDGTTSYENGPTGPNRMRTEPVGSFPPNAFGIHDMHGNVWEWVEDCWNDTYASKPADGSPWLTGSCTGRVMRGGSWEDYSGEVRAGARVGNGVGDAYWSDGIRVARDL
jgi:formylglycine-generating enzyme required for sulfatase activity